jgi:PKD repeat protein
MKKEKTLVLVLGLILILFLISSVSAFDSGWTKFNTVYGCSTDGCGGSTCTPNLGSSASAFGLDWIQFMSYCAGNGPYKFLSQTSANLLLGAGEGKLVSIPSTGNYYVSVSAKSDSVNNHLYLGVNDWGVDTNRIQAFNFLNNYINCTFKTKFNLNSNPAKIWVETAVSDTSSTRVHYFRVSDTLPSDSTNYCENSLSGMAIPASDRCTPKTCALNYSGKCGTQDDGCGGTLNCNNNCNSGFACNAVTKMCVPPYFGNSLDNGLISMWNFDLSGGSNATFAADALGKNNGSVVNVQQIISGVKGQAYNFTASDSKIQIANEQNFDMIKDNAITVSAWISPDFRGPIVVKGGGSGAGNTYVNYALSRDLDNKITFSIYVVIVHTDFSVGTIGEQTCAIFSGYTSSSPLVFSDNVPGQIVMTYNFSHGNTMQMYFNGLPITGSWASNYPQSHGSCNYNVGPDGDPAFALNNWPLYLGASYLNYYPSSSGVLDEVGIWNRSLNSSEVAQLYEYYVPNTKLLSANWRNLNGDIISRADTNDTVATTLSGLKLEGKTINYTIEKDIPWWFDTRIAQTSNTGASFWTAGKKIDGTFSNGNYYFIAGILGFGANVSATIPVDNLLGANGNSMPRAVISNPVNGFLSAVNRPVDFAQQSSDEDDLLKLTWNFGDGTNESYYNYSSFLSSSLGNTVHTYSQAGIYNVKLTAAEMERTQSNSDIITIYVLQPGINVIPIISSPNRTQAYQNWVNFNASQSFVANCTRGQMANVNLVVGDLNCSYLHIPGKKIITGNYDLRVNWTIMDENNGISLSRSGSWKNNYSSVVDFNAYFDSAKKRTALLNIVYSTS